MKIKGECREIAKQVKFFPAPSALQRATEGQMVIPLLAGIIFGLVMLGIGGFQMAGDKYKEGRWFMLIGGLALFCSLGLLVFSLWVFASGM